MKKVLFRKLVVDDVIYYQVYKVGDDIELTEDVADYSHRKEKDFFYIENDQFDESFLYSMFYEDDGKIQGLTFDNKKLFVKVFNAFKNKFGDIEGTLVVKELKSIDEIVDKVNKKVLFQKENVRQLVSQIYQNQNILASDLPDDIKTRLKGNILFHGMVGTGKNTIVDILEEELDIPYADVKISTDLNKVAQDIATQLLNRASNQEEATNGIVFLRDNFEEIIDLFDGDEEKAYMTVDYLTRIGKVSIDGNIIDFDKLTFVVLLDRSDMLFNENDLLDTMGIMGCYYETSTDTLNVGQKYLILLKSNGRISIYKKFLESIGVEFTVDDKSLKKLIRYCAKIEPGMHLLNSAIDIIIKKGLFENRHRISIDDESVEFLMSTFTYYNEEEKEVEKPKSELTKDEIYNEVIKAVIGQDEHVKRILYTIMENRRMANIPNLENPEMYIDNIMIRGQSGSGKTLILNTICKLLNIPFASVDATDYTETGYKGADVKGMLIQLLHNADDNLEEAQKGILHIDEIDKKAGHGDMDVTRGAVQDGLLKIVEGASISLDLGTPLNPDKVYFDTSRLTVVCSGAFDGIDAIRDARIRRENGQSLGFNNKKPEEVVNKELTDADFKEYGMREQFMVRFPVKVELNKHDTKSLKEIMIKSKVSSLVIQKYKLESKGIEVEYTDDFYDELAKRAFSLKIGARGIAKALQKVLASIHIEDIEPENVAKIIFTGEVLSDPSKIILIPREQEKQKVKRK